MRYFFIKSIYIMNIVGYINYTVGVATPVVWANASATTVPASLNVGVGGDDGIANGINSLGQIVGYINYDGVETPVSWADASYTTVPTKLNLNGGSFGNAAGINSLGQIVGYINYAGVNTPVIWTNSTAQPERVNFTGGSDGFAVGINSLGQISGFITYNGVQTPVSWTNTTAQATLLNFTGGSLANATGINRLGQIVGIIVYNGVETPVVWTNVAAVPKPLDFTGGINGGAQGINSLGQIVGAIRYTDELIIPVSWANDTVMSTPLNLNGGLSGTAFGIQDPPEPVPEPISNICFPAGTPIQTDQGLVNIEFLDKRTHTINNKGILHITKTSTLDKYLIRFAQSALGRNVPDKKTIMTKDHQIMFEGRLVPAYRFLDYTDQVKKVKYSGETLYNVLLKEHGVMNVNNLLCETLHPDNIIAKLYLTNYSDEERSSIVYQMNTALLNNDVLTYKAVVDRLTLML